MNIESVLDTEQTTGQMHEQHLLEWESPMRPYKQRSAVLLRFVFVLAVLLTFFVYFFADMVTILPIWVVLFLFYVLATTKPPSAIHRLTTFGIETAGVSIRWDSLSYYFYTKKYGQDVLTIVGKAPYSFHIYVVLPNTIIKDETNKILSKHLMYVAHPPEDLTDKLSNLLSKLLPDDEARVVPV